MWPDPGGRKTPVPGPGNRGGAGLGVTSGIQAAVVFGKGTAGGKGMAAAATGAGATNSGCIPSDGGM